MRDARDQFILEEKRLAAAEYHQSKVWELLLGLGDPGPDYVTIQPSLQLGARFETALLASGCTLIGTKDGHAAWVDPEFHLHAPYAYSDEPRETRHRKRKATEITHDRDHGDAIAMRLGAVLET